MDKHVVVVGAGVGGLTASIELAIAGVRVTVVDKAPHAGGKLRTIELAGRSIGSDPFLWTARAYAA